MCCVCWLKPCRQTTRFGHNFLFLICLLIIVWHFLMITILSDFICIWFLLWVLNLMYDCDYPFAVLRDRDIPEDNGLPLVHVQLRHVRLHQQCRVCHRQLLRGVRQVPGYTLLESAVLQWRRSSSTGWCFRRLLSDLFLPLPLRFTGVAKGPNLMSLICTCKVKFFLKSRRTAYHIVTFFYCKNFKRCCCRNKQRICSRTFLFDVLTFWF